LQGIAQEIDILHVKGPVQAIGNPYLFAFLLGGVLACQHQDRVPGEPENQETDKGYGQKHHHALAYALKNISSHVGSGSGAAAAEALAGRPLL
jgi:hypothetical protein